VKIRNGLINLTKENIYHFYPKVIHIDIAIKRLPNRGYESRIALRTKSESFFALKKNSGYRKSLEKSYHAIMKQLEKVKINKIHRSYSGIIFKDSAQEDVVT